MKSQIMHVDMDAFFASIEQQLNPALRRKPVIVGGRNDKYRSIVCAASYEAKALGIDSAMPSWRALQICPEAIFVPSDTSKYVYTSEKIFDILKSFGPKIEAFSVDEFFLDISDCGKSFGSIEKMGYEIKKRIRNEFGLTCSIGVAPTRITAKLAAKLGKPDGLVILNKRQVLDLMENLPVEKICGIGRGLKRKFNRLGIQTCGQLRQYPPRLLKEHFGVMGLWLKAVCLAEDISYIEGHEKGNTHPKSIGHSQTLRKLTVDRGYIDNWIHLLSYMVAERLRRKRLQGKTVLFYFADGFHGSHAKQRTFHNATYDGFEIYQRSLIILKMMNVKDLKVRILGVSVSHLSHAQNTYLFEREIKREQLLQSLDRINDRFGQWTLFPAALMRTSLNP